MSSSLRTQGIILRRTNYGEADRIVQLLTPEGKVSALARGVRKEKSKLAGGIELFAVSDVVISKGKGELGILTSTRLIKFYGHIVEEYYRMQVGYEVIKQISRASEMLDEPEWYDLLLEVLAALDVKTIPLMLVQTWFYLHYTALLGHGLSLRYDVSGELIREDATYRYDVAEQGFRDVQHGEITAAHIKLLRLIASRSIRILVQIGGIEPLLADCLQVAREHAAL